WVASYDDRNPYIKFTWNDPQTIRQIDLMFDTDYDHPMETVLMGHPEDVMPFCVRNYRIMDDQGNTVFEKQGNYQTYNQIRLESAVVTRELTIFVEHPSEHVPAAVFGVRCYSE